MYSANKDILFLSTMIPKELSEVVRKKSKSNMQDAANALQWHIYDGLKENLGERPSCINIMPLGSYPQYYEDAFVKRQVLEYDGSSIYNVGFCNIKFIRKFLLSRKIYKELKRYYKNVVHNHKVLLMYTLNESFLKAVKRIKKKYQDIKVCAIVADLPDMLSLSSKTSFIHNCFAKYLAKKAYRNMGCVDGYVLLTEQMAEYLKISPSPYCVMEGIATVTERNFVKDAPKDNVKRILYSGTLHKKFGVLNLVEAFLNIDDPNFRLLICGVGDSENEIKQASEKDSRIEFLGQITREEVLRLQRSVDVLVNPRQNNEEFTKYSFPSKNLEYLSSGIPLIAYKLDGIPADYTPFINYVEDDGIQSLSAMLKDVCYDLNGEYLKRAEYARKFVTEEKNEKKQANIILELLLSL